MCAARVCASTGVRRQGRGGRGGRPAPSPGLRAPTPSFASAAHCLATCAGAGGKGLSEMRPTDLRPACASRQGAEGAGNCAIHHVRAASAPPAAPGGPAGPALRGEAATSGVASGTARGTLGKAEGRGGGAGFPCLEGSAGKRVLPVWDESSRPSRDRRPGPARPGGLPAGLAPASGTALCWLGGGWGRGREREGAGGGSRGLSWDSAATLPSPFSRARPGLETGCVLLEVRRGHLFAFPAIFTLWGHLKDLPEGASTPARAGLLEAAGRRAPLLEKQPQTSP